MTKKPAPSDLADKFMLRLPEGLRDRIANIAKANNRSMNAEIVATLEGKYPAPNDFDQAIAEISRFVAQLDTDEAKRDYLQSVIKLINKEMESRIGARIVVSEK